MAAMARRRPRLGIEALLRDHLSPLTALLEDHCRVAAGHAVRYQWTQALLLGALVQKRIADESNERFEFSAGKMDWRLKQRIDSREHRFDRTQPIPKVLGDARFLRIV